MKKEGAGNITVFTALCLMLVASLFLALLESARVYGLNTRAGLLAELGAESVCAEYHSKMWEDYGLLCLDGAYGGSTFSTEQVSARFGEMMAKNLSRAKWGADFFALTVPAAELSEYQFLTDGDGSVFFALVSSYMKENLPKDTAEAILERYKSGQNLKEDTDTYSVENAKNAIEQAAESVEDTEYTESAEETGDTENPLEIVLELKRNAILGMVVGQVEELSANQISIEETLRKRTLNQGTKKEMPEGNWYERVLVLEYAGRHFSDYTKPSETHALSYEMEYLLCGKAEDKANLEGTVIRLLALRETANVAHILKDTEKKNRAMAIAQLLAGFTGNPAVIQAVQAGVIAAWAYMESIQDVRALLAGDKIALVKSRAQWTVDTQNLLESFQKTAKAKNCENGWSYQDYLKLMLYPKTKKVLAMRMMDVMEQNLRQTARYRNCRMDNLITELEITAEYDAAPLFSKLVVIGRTKTKRYSFCTQARFSYLTGNMIPQ